MVQTLIDVLYELIDKYKAHDWLSVCGHPSWSFFVIKDKGPYSAIELKSLYLQNMLSNDILINASHNLSYAHKKQDIEKLLAIYEQTIVLLLETISKENFSEVFYGALLEPVFKVR
jgi:glutamate-1-semialdehyde 2,1-aminomutase